MDCMDTEKESNKTGNYQAKLRGSQLSCPDLEVTSLKTKMTNKTPHPVGMKKPRKSDINYMPLFLIRETEETLEKS